MNIALCGLGKAGKKFVEYTLNDEKNCLSAVLCRDESVTRGKRVSDVTNVKMENDLVVQSISEFDNKEDLDVIIDFSNTATTMKLISLCARYNINLVICPTKFSESQMRFIKDMAETNNIGVVFAPTLTIGVNMLMDFVSKVASLFPDFSFEIIEKHPRTKASPTQTAEIIATSLGRECVPISSVRLDGYVGVHEVIATNGNERISVVHESFDRNAFASGALVAANFIYGKIGFFEIKDIYKEMISNYHNQL